MNRVEIKISGFGGQGVILAGMIIGRAASIYDSKDATLTQSFGPEARGGACSAQVVVDSERILYPCVVRPDILVTMSQPAFDQYMSEISPTGQILFEENLVQPHGVPTGVQLWGIPATRFAEELGRKMVLNIIMVGFFTALTDLVGLESVKKSIGASVPQGTQQLNLDAFERGYQHGLSLRAQKAK